MKLLKSSLMAVLGVAVALTSCSDDNKYEPGKVVEGAFFAYNLQTDIEIDEESTSFEIPVYRTENSPLSYELTSSDASGLFKIPTVIDFAEGSYQTTLSIAYDPAKIAQKVEYPISLTIADGKELFVGYTGVNLIVSAPEKPVTEPFMSGTGFYVFSVVFSGSLDMPIDYSYFESDPDHNVWWTLGGFLGDVGYEYEDITITAEDVSEPLVDGVGDSYYVVHVPPQYTGYYHATYGPIYICDAYYYELYLNDLGYTTGDSADSLEDTSVYWPDYGEFDLYVRWYVPEYDKGTSGFGLDTEFYLVDEEDASAFSLPTEFAPKQLGEPKSAVNMPAKFNGPLHTAKKLKAVK